MANPPSSSSSSIKVELEPYDELDHIPFKQRLKLLLATKIDSSSHVDDLQREANLPKTLVPLPTDAVVKKEENDGSLQGMSVGMSAYKMDDINHCSAGKLKEHSQLIDRQNSNDYSHGIANDNCSTISTGPIFDSSSSKIVNLTLDTQYPPKGCDYQESLSPKPNNILRSQENGEKCLSQGMHTEYEPPVERELVPFDARNMHVVALPDFLVKVKVETMDTSLESPYENTMAIPLKNKDMVVVKTETGIWEESCDDVIDHMPLRERKQLLLARNAFNVDCSRNLKCLRKTLPSSFECDRTVSETGKPEGIIRLRKRKKTCTDSVETALEEDAPGLLKALIDKGILVDEIKLYGEDNESDDPLDISEEDSFEDLEAVVSKLFSQGSTLLKLGPLRCTNVSKPSYCLTCLLSLVEQARYLMFRKWPVEWGWCRDLQSFIFVFERHHRIVLERPEYGYATYFFELVASLPVEWQIKRLVIAMKLTSCGRTTLVENKPLLVGDDLSEGEARVLEEYGWTPNSGLGSMLNYCDRVYHDRKNEGGDVSEWRSKIGKLLMDGHDGGTTELTHLPKKFKGYKHTTESTLPVEAFE